MTKICGIPNCTDPYLCKGYCSKHYQRLRKFGDPLRTFYGHLDDKFCSKCQINDKRPDHSWCQPCLNELSRHRSASEKGPRYRRYGLTRTDIENKKSQQNNRCSICNDSFETVPDHVDHDNKCCPKNASQTRTCGNCVRDLLCGSCNQGLGNFKDDIIRLQAAVNYLEKWSNNE